jgi:endoglucanase
MLKTKLLQVADGPADRTVTNPYRIPGNFFFWGGNSAYANCGMLFMQAYNLTGKQLYFNAAVSSLDYIMGRNATTYSFVSGFGTKYPEELHHRLSGGDTIPGAFPVFWQAVQTPEM